MYLPRPFVPSLAEFQESWLNEEAFQDDPDAVPTVTYNRDEAMDALIETCVGAREPNWNGEGALAVSPRMVRQASAFMLALPLGMPLPEVDASPQGTLLFSWHSAPRRRLVVEVNEDGELAYAALLGLDRQCGTCFFVEFVPPEILVLIDGVSR
jgi:hypothetical protein